MKNQGNFFENLPSEKLPAELFETIQKGKNFKIERIVSMGHVTPEGQWYDQEQDEWVILLRGAARLLIEDEETINLAAGNYLFIPAHQRHCVVWTDPDDVCVWLAVYVDV